MSIRRLLAGTPVLAVLAVLSLTAPAGAANECDCTPQPMPSFQLPGQAQLVALNLNSGVVSKVNWVTLNPQPIPPGRVVSAVLRFNGDTVALNPQPIPPGFPLPPFALLATKLFSNPDVGLLGGPSLRGTLVATDEFGITTKADYVALNPQPIPPGRFALTLGVGTLLSATG